jgi:hypothetical protein
MGRPVTGASKLYLSFGFILLFAADAAMPDGQIPSSIEKL